MKPKFTYDNVVHVRSTASPDLQPGSTASIVGVFETRPGPYFDKFPAGTVYTIEFEDGPPLEIHEEDLE